MNIYEGITELGL